jgi:hypothetical protein
MNDLDLIIFISQYATTLNNVYITYSLPISSLAIFRTCMLYIGLIGFRNACLCSVVQNETDKFFDAFTVIASEVTYIVQMYGKSVMK